MRTTEELLTIVRDAMINRDSLRDPKSPVRPLGICGVINFLGRKSIITRHEQAFIRSFILRRPPKDDSFGERTGVLKSILHYGQTSKNLFYWEAGEYEPRIKYLNYHINHLKELHNETD